MTWWLQQLLRCSLAMSALSLAYCAATVCLRRRYAAKWFYLIAMALLLGFLLPLRPVVPVRSTQLPALLQGGAGQAAGAWAVPATPAANGQPTAQGFPWTTAFAVWIAGVAATLLYHGIRHARFLRAVRRWSWPVQDPALLTQFAQAKRELHMEGATVALAHCACVHSPMLLWLGRPTVLLPEDTAAGHGTRFILLHELIHCKRHDLLCRLVMLAATAMHWFNPAVYLLVKLATLQCEISCDNRVVRREDAQARHRYAMSLINLARRQTKGHTLLTTNLYGRKRTMKKRIASVYHPAKTRGGALLLACTLLLTLLAGTSLAVDTTGDSIAYTLPEAAIRSGETVEAYPVSWQTDEAIRAYYLGVCYQLETGEGDLWTMAEGYIGTHAFSDDTGATYVTRNAIMDSIVLEGDATETDIGALINKHVADLNAEGGRLLAVNLSLVAVREIGEPIQMTIEILVE